MGWGGKVAQAPYTVTRRRAPGPRAAATCIVVPSPITSAHACSAHKLPVCVTCKWLCLLAATCCAKGHHALGYVDHMPLSKVCQAHGLLPCPRRTLMQRGVGQCCQRGHHKVNTPHKRLARGPWKTGPSPPLCRHHPVASLAAAGPEGRGGSTWVSLVWR